MKKLASLLSFFLVFTCSVRESLALDKCIVIDIDATFAQILAFPEVEDPKVQESIHKRLQFLKESNQLVAFQHYYYIFGGANRFVQYILDYKLIPFKIKFFSAGPAKRNIAVLTKYFSKFHSPDELKAWEQEGQFQVYSNDHLTSIFSPTQAEPGRIIYQKNLITAGCDPQWSIIIDDYPGYILPLQTSSHLLAPTDFIFKIQNFLIDETIPASWSELASSHSRLYDEMNKFAFYAGFLSKVFEKYEADSEQKELARFSFKLNLDLIRNKESKEDLYTRGHALLGKYEDKEFHPDDLAVSLPETSGTEETIPSRNFDPSSFFFEEIPIETPAPSLLRKLLNWAADCLGYGPGVTQ